MNNANEKRRVVEQALRDAMVEQVWALSDDEVAQEARLQGNDLQAAVASVRAARDKAAYAVSIVNSDSIVALKSVRSPDIIPQSPPRHRLARPQRLAANVAPPTSPQSTAASKKADQPGSHGSKDTDQPKS